MRDHFTTQTLVHACALAVPHATPAVDNEAAVAAGEWMRRELQEGRGGSCKKEEVDENKGLFELLRTQLSCKPASEP